MIDIGAKLGAWRRTWKVMAIHDQEARPPVIAAALTALIIAAVVKILFVVGLPTAGDVASEPSDPGPLPAVRHFAWPGVSYQEVRAYYYREWPFHPSQGILDLVDRKEGVLLNALQERRLISAVTTRIRPHPVIEMWYPQNAFVFFDSSGRPVAEVAISFNSVFVVGPDIPNYPDIVALADLVDELGLPVGDGGDADTFRRKFNELSPN